MGRPYESELRALPESYLAAMQLDVDPLVSAIVELRSIPLVAVGSGGSLVAAHFAATLHHEFARAPARAVTPWLITHQTNGIGGGAIMLISAGGSNSDVLGAFRHVLAAEPDRVIILCARINSPLAKLARRYNWVDLLEFELPCGKDGFLATNSLLAFGTLLVRAYEQSAKQRSRLPPSVDQFVTSRANGIEKTITGIGKRASRLWTRDHLLVLYGPETEAAAYDIESKFTEAALGAVQVADYRNFGHGRHHWLAKRGLISAVLALRTSQDLAIVRAMLRQIPESVPVVDLPIPGTGGVAGLAAIFQSIILAWHCARARGIDPGRPGVPSFGRRLYHLRAIAEPPKVVHQVPASIACAIRRKTAIPVDLLSASLLRGYLAGYRRFVARLRAARFDGLALEYDGTLCDGRNRKSGPCKDILNELTRITAHGTSVLIVTGRGKSVRDDLRRLLDIKVWAHVRIGYYNGAQIAELGDDRSPQRGEIGIELKEAAARIAADPLLASFAVCECREAQISVQPTLPLSLENAYGIIMQALSPRLRSRLSIVRSGHSVDVLAPGVSKLCALETLSKSCNSILSIGDAGRWPGNDLDLLSRGITLSVKEVSSDPATCWNLAPPGVRGSQAMLYYLKLIRPDKKLIYVRMRTNIF